MTSTAVELAFNQDITIWTTSHFFDVSYFRDSEPDKSQTKLQTFWAPNDTSKKVFSNAWQNITGCY